MADGAVLLKDNKIHDVGRKADIGLPDADVRMIDAKGGTILPGMIDAHVHIIFNGFDLQKMMMEPFSYQFFDVIANLKRTIECGVTTIRDAGLCGSTLASRILAQVPGIINPSPGT